MNAVERALLRLADEPKLPHERFRQFEETARGRRAAQLLQSTSLSVDTMLQIVFASVSECVEGMKPDVKYTVRDFCGDDLWLSWGFASRRTAGMCMAFLVDRGLVLVRLHRTQRGKGTRKYLSL